MDHPPLISHIGEVLGSLGESLPVPSARSGRRVGFESRDYWHAGPVFLFVPSPVTDRVPGRWGSVGRLPNDIYVHNWPYRCREAVISLW